MRLQRLDLTRYGKFTGHTIDFGPRRDGVPDFHIVYGPNEAGKSTALAAYLDLLFGIERTNRYNFLHPYNVMQIGAALAVGGRVHELRRIKRTLNTLLDAQDQPVSDDLIRAHLGKIDRKSYCAMFSLDDDTIEQGGDDILASKGDLGRALFSASAGVAGLSQMLAGLREEAEQFHKPRGRDTRLNELKARLAELRAQRDGIDTAAAAHARLVAARDQAREAYEEAVARRGEIQARSEQVQRYLGAWPRLAALRTLHAAIAPLAHLPPAPPSWKQALSDLQTKAANLTARLDSAARDIAGRAAASAPSRMTPPPCAWPAGSVAGPGRPAPGRPRRWLDRAAGAGGHRARHSGPAGGAAARGYDDCRSAGPAGPSGPWQSRGPDPARRGHRRAACVAGKPLRHRGASARRGG